MSYPSKISFTLIITTIFMSLLLAGCAGDPETKKKDHYDKAMAHVEQQNEKAAILELRNAIQIDPKFADARYQLALLYLEQGEMRKAFNELQRVSSLDPDNLDARIKTAEFLLMARDKDGARKHTEEVLAAAPDNIDPLALMTNIEIIEGNFDKAERHINEAFNLEPDQSRLHAIRGRLLVAQQKYTEAEAAFKKAITVEPDNRTSHQMLLTFYQSRQDHDKALAVAEKMINRFPDSPIPYIQLASLHRQAENNSKAEAVLLKAADKFPDNDKLQLILADFYTKDGQPEKAAQAYRAAMVHSDNPLDIKAQLADHYFKQQNFILSRKLIDEIRAETMKNSRANLVHAKFLLKNDKPKEALTILDSLVRNNPRMAESYFNKAMAHMSLGQLRMAQSAASEAIKQDPRNSRYHTLLAQLFFNDRDMDSARQEAAIALKLEPGNFQAALLLTKCVLFTGEYGHAVKMLEEMNAKVPGNYEVIVHLALAHLGKKDMAKAEMYFEQILSARPDDIFATQNLLRIKAGQGKSEAELLKMVKTQTDLVPDSAGMNLLLAHLLTGEKKYADALEVLGKVQELAPQDPQAYSLTATILNRQGKTSQAIDEFKRLLEENPQNIQAHMSIAVMLDQKGETAEARTWYEKTLAIRPDFAPAANNLAWLIAESDNPDLGEALRLAMLAKDQRPDDVHIIDTLGWVHYKRNSYALARNEFSQAVEKQPDIPILRYHLALALYGEGEKEQAVKELQAALNSTNDFQKRKEAEALLSQWQDS